MLRIVISIVTLICASFVSSAQTKEIKHDFTSFDKIEIDNDFRVNIVNSKDQYSVDVTIDALLQDYLQTYVRDNTLHVGIDTKAITSQIKKALKEHGQNEMKLTVHMPAGFSSLKMTGGIFDSPVCFECNDVNIELSNSAQIKSLTLDADNVTVKAEDKSYAHLELFSEEVSVIASGSAGVDLKYDCQKLNINLAGNATAQMDGHSLETEVIANAFSKLTLKGGTDFLTVDGQHMAVVDALNLQTPECSALLSGNAKLTEAATEKLHIDISGLTTLIYDNEPSFDIKSIKTSTVKKYSPTDK